jgi:glutathione S-transferase
MRVRWALEEVGQPYDLRLVSFSEMKEPAHRALHPFGQIPTYEEGDLALFESGAIVFHIAERHPGLLPNDANARARAITWMFSALNTVEPPLVDREIVMREERDKPWYEQRLRLVEDRARKPLSELSSRLGDAEWLDGAFNAGDLLRDREYWTSIRTSRPMSPAAKRGPPSSVLLTLNWRSSPPRRAAD